MDSITALIRDAEERGRQRAERRAEQKANEKVEQNTVQALINLMSNTGWKLPKAMDALAIPKNMRPKYGKLVKAALAVQESAVANL